MSADIPLTAKRSAHSAPSQYHEITWCVCVCVCVKKVQECVGIHGVWVAQGQWCPAAPSPTRGSLRRPARSAAVVEGPSASGNRQYWLWTLSHPIPFPPTTWLPMAFNALPLSPNDHPTTAQGSPGSSRVTLKSQFFFSANPANPCWPKNSEVLSGGVPESMLSIGNVGIFCLF